MINLSDIATGLLGLGVIAGSAGLVAVGHLASRNRTADQHDVGDYRPTVEVELTGSAEQFAATIRETVRRRLRSDAWMVLGPGAEFTPASPSELVAPLDTLPSPAAPSIWDHMVARRWLEEIAAEQQAKAGIRPRLVSTADRDMVGAFPVVRAA